MGSSHIAQGDQLVLCDHLERWDREGVREMQEGGDMGIYIYICIADSFCYKAETNTPL